MSLNDTAAVEVMGWVETEQQFCTERVKVGTFWYADRFRLWKEDFTPDSSYTDAMLVRDKAVERYKAHLGKKRSGNEYPLEYMAQAEFVARLGEVIKAHHELTRFRVKVEDAVFATPAQITEASIALVRRMK